MPEPTYRLVKVKMPLQCIKCGAPAANIKGNYGEFGCLICSQQYELVPLKHLHGGFKPVSPHNLVSGGV